MAPAPLKRAGALFVTARCVESPADISYHSHHLAPPELLKLLSLSRLPLGKPRQVPAPITILHDLVWGTLLSPWAVKRWKLRIGSYL